MNLLESALRRIASDLDRHGREWALIGGFAVSARAEPRFTRDIDLALAVGDDSEVEDLVRGLVGDGYALTGMIEHEVSGRIATVRLVPARQPIGGEVVTDLLFASSGIEPEVVAAAEPLEILPDLTVRVARSGHLIALKILARDDAERPRTWRPTCASGGVNRRGSPACALEL